MHYPIGNRMQALFKIAGNLALLRQIASASHDAMLVVDQMRLADYDVSLAIQPSKPPAETTLPLPPALERDAKELRSLLKDHLTRPAFWNDGANHLRRWRECEREALDRSASGSVGIRVAASSTECLSRHADGGGRGPARLAAYPRLRLQPSLPANGPHRWRISPST